MPQKDFDFAAALSAFESQPAFQLRPDKGGMRVVIRGGNTLRSGHAHLEINKAEKRDQTTIELELVSGTHGKLPREVFTLDRAISILGSLLKTPAKARVIVLSANFTFSLKEWEPTIPLPFSPGAMVGELPGVPQICGLDFAFTNQSESQLLHRAFVTTYDNTEQMVVRFFLGHAEVFDTSLPERVFELVTAHVPIFARKRGTPLRGKSAN